MSDEYLEMLERICKEATPAPWRARVNLPFYAEMVKPAPSLSKHDSDRPDYWRIEDATFVVTAREAMPLLIAEIRKLRAEG